MWAGGTFFLVVLYVVSVFGSGGKKVLVQFWFTLDLRGLEEPAHASPGLEEPFF